MSNMSRRLIAVGSLVALTVGIGPAKAAESPPAQCSRIQHTFSLTIDNQYAPMVPNQVSTYFGVAKQRLGLTIAVTNDTMAFYNGAVNTRVVVETEWGDKNANGALDQNEKLIEISRNYFAQTEAGTVCYFGEDVNIYKSGKFKGDTTGSWRADGSGNAPGIFMPAAPQTGDHWLMEFAPGIALDQVTVDGFETRTVPAGTFNNAMRVQECSPIDGDCDIKYYAPGVGLIIDEALELTSH